MAEGRRELIDMAVFGPVPEFVRVSVRLTGLRAERAAPAASALLARCARRAAALAQDDPRFGRWRTAYEAVGLPEVIPPHQALVAWAAAPGGVPSQGALADLVHAFALQHMVPAAVYDLRAAAGHLWLRPTRGTERFEGLDGLAAPPEVGELVLADSADRVLARHWHGAQARATCVGPATREALVHLDVLPPVSVPPADLADAFGRLVTGFVGGRADVRLLSRAEPRIEWPAT